MTSQEGYPEKSRSTTRSIPPTRLRSPGRLRYGSQFPIQWQVFQTFKFHIPGLVRLWAGFQRIHEEGSLNQPLTKQLDNLAGIFPDQITPLHSNLHLQPNITPSNHKRGCKLHLSQICLCIWRFLKNFITCTTYSSTRKSPSFRKSKFPSNLPYEKSRYSPNNLPDFTSGYELNFFSYQSSSNQILDQWCLDVLEYQTTPWSS